MSCQNARPDGTSAGAGIGALRATPIVRLIPRMVARTP
jgi:hypothetical protein